MREENLAPRERKDAFVGGGGWEPLWSCFNDSSYWHIRFNYICLLIGGFWASPHELVYNLRRQFRIEEALKFSFYTTYTVFTTYTKMLKRSKNAERLNYKLFDKLVKIEEKIIKVWRIADCSIINFPAIRGSFSSSDSFQVPIYLLFWKTMKGSGGKTSCRRLRGMLV